TSPSSWPSRCINRPSPRGCCCWPCWMNRIRWWHKCCATAGPTSTLLPVNWRPSRRNWKRNFSGGGMSDVFADRLVNAIQQKGSPICVGIDPIFEMLPDGIAGVASKHKSDDAEAAIDAIFAFTTAVLRIVAPHVPCVKFQSAYFEKYLWEGVEAYYSLLAEARELGLVVIGDVKRG